MLSNLVTYSTGQVKFKWSEENYTKPLTVNPKIALPDLFIQNATTTFCNETNIIGNTSCLRVLFLLERETGFYESQVYIPTAITLMFSWISVWLPVEFLEGRIGVAITVLLIVATEANGVRAGLPFVSYIKAIDIWLGFIKGFVFTTLMQTLVVLGLSRKAAVLEKWSRKKSFCQEERDELEERSEFFFRAAQSLDLCCRVLYPIVFFLFLGYYFGISIRGSQDSCIRHNMTKLFRN